MDHPTAHVLLVDGDAAHLELIRRAFESHGRQMRLTAVRTLREARALLADSPPDLVIVDIDLPDGNGMDLLPGREGEGPFPVVVLTRNGNEKAAVEAIKLGAVDYVVKSESSLVDMPHIASHALHEWQVLLDRKRLERLQEESQAELERRVRERTAELTAANEALRLAMAERLKAEEAARKSQDLFRTFFELGLVGFAVTSPRRGWLVVNDRLCEMLGYTRQELAATTWDRLTHPEEVDAEIAYFEQVKTGTLSMARHEKRYVRKDGSILHVLVSHQCVYKADGSLHYVLSVVEDISERKEAEERLRRLQVELAHLDRLKIMGEMATGLAHELNQPLTAILMHAELACRKLDLGCQLGPDELKKTWQMIADQAYRSGQIIRRMRDFVRKSDPVQAPLDFAGLVDEVLSLLQSDLRHRGIQVVTSFPTPLPKIVADKIQVQQVLLNLARNAIEAMDATPPDDRLLGVQAEVRGALLEVSVSDTGCGIPADTGDQLFSLFHTTKATGMGLGLAICRSIVERHGGRIWAGPHGPQGTVFTLTLPTVQTTPAPGARTDTA